MQGLIRWVQLTPSGELPPTHTSVRLIAALAWPAAPHVYLAWDALHICLAWPGRLALACS